MQINRIAKKAYKTAIKREANGAGVKIESTLNHCFDEVIEAKEAFVNWRQDETKKSEYAEELADVILCVLIAAKRDGINIEKAVKEKNKKNRLRAEKNGDKL